MAMPTSKKPDQEKPIFFTHQMEASFRCLFLDWLDQNQEALESGGTGDVRALMTLLFSLGAQAPQS
jgi:hypothetical protein